MPSNLEAEQAVLGACIIDEDAIFVAMGILKPSCFYLEKHGWIFKALLQLVDQKAPIDFLSVVTQLETEGRLGEVGGAAYITALMGAVPTAAHVEHFAHIVFSLYQLRRMIYASTEIAGAAYNGAAPDKVDDLILRAHNLLDNIPIRSDSGNLINMGQAVQIFEKEMDYAVAHPGDIWGIPTGLRRLDNYFGGLQLGDFWILAGDPGMGKTALLNKILLNVAIKGTGVMYFSLEMSVKKLMRRLAADLSNIPSKRIRQGKLSPEDVEAIRAKMRELKDIPLFIEDKPVSTVGIRNQMMRASRFAKISVVGVDYSQLLLNRSEDGKEVVRVMTISRELKNLAKEFDCCVLLVHTITRDKERQAKMPKLSELAWSRSTEYDPDVVIFPHFDKFNRPANSIEAEIGVGKNRDGSDQDLGGKLPHTFDGVRWADAARKDEIAQQMLLGEEAGK